MIITTNVLKEEPNPKRPLSGKFMLMEDHNGYKILVGQFGYMCLSDGYGGSFRNSDDFQQFMQQGFKKVLLSDVVKMSISGNNG